MRKQTLYSLFALAAFALPGLSADKNAVPDLSSLPPEQAASQIIYYNDKDGNKMLSKDEVDMNFRVRRFNSVDKNNDGLLDQVELTESYRNAAQVRQQEEATRPADSTSQEGWFSKIKRELRS